MDPIDALVSTNRGVPDGSVNSQKWDEQVFRSETLFAMKKSTQHLIAEVPGRHFKTAMTIGVALGDVWSHYCTLNRAGEVVDRGRFRTTPKAVVKWFTDLAPHARALPEHLRDVVAAFAQIRLSDKALVPHAESL